MLLFLLCAASAFAEIPSALLDDPQLKALSEHPQWRALLHYDKTLRYRVIPGGQQSRTAAVDSHDHNQRSLFLSAAGARDPELELIATLRALFDQHMAHEDANPICLYPGRYRWLKAQLGSHNIAWPRAECPRLHEWLSNINAHSVSVIFPASFLNNPASAFGHTFLRLNQRGQTEKTPLLAHASDYAAATGGEDMITYSFKGVFGGYQGFYSIAPSYEKVTTYSDLENRDIWEYHLDLTKEEVDLLTLHIWELRSVPFTYYYFDENCSYHVLALLQVAKPDLPLLNSHTTWVLPADTIRTLEEHDLIAGATFRPSAATKLRHRIAHARPRVQRAAHQMYREGTIADNAELAALSAADQAAAVDLAYEFLTYKRIKEGSNDEREKQLAWSLLDKRSALPPGELSDPLPPARPESGHKTVSISFGLGRTQGGRGNAEFVFRPALHAFSDDSRGFLPGAQIKFMETAVRADESDEFDLERFTLLDIKSFTARNLFLKPISWRLRFEGARVRSAAGDDPFVISNSGGGGVAYEPLDNFLVHGLLTADLQLAGPIEHNHALGAGPEIGFLLKPLDWTATEASAAILRYELGDDHTACLATVAQRVSLSPDHAVRVEYSQRSEFGGHSNELFFRYQMFFSP